jgi:hypothetical protein
VPTNRTPLNRHRTPLFDEETVALFVELENTPPRRRKSKEFDQKDYALHKRLGLGGERLCSQVSVLDRRATYYRPEAVIQYEDWRRVHGVRLQLLARCGRAS